MLDARAPLGTRCKHLEQHLRKNAQHKHMLLLLNKCDLVSLPSSAVRAVGGDRPCAMRCPCSHTSKMLHWEGQWILLLLSHGW